LEKELTVVADIPDHLADRSIACGEEVIEALGLDRRIVTPTREGAQSGAGKRA